MAEDTVKASVGNGQGIYNYNSMLADYTDRYVGADEYTKIMLKLWLYDAMARTNLDPKKEVPVYSEYISGVTLLESMNMVKSKLVDLRDIGTYEEITKILLTNHEGY